MNGREPSRIGAALAARLAVLAPDGLRAVFWGQPLARRVFAVDQPNKRNEIAISTLMGGAPDHKLRRGMIDLVIPATLCLERQVTAPRSARARLGPMALLDLRQRTPFGAQDVFTQLGTPHVDGDQIKLKQWVVTRRDVKDWRAALARHAVRLRRLYVAGNAAPIADFSAELAPGARRVRLLNGTLALAAVMIGLGGWLYPAWHATQQTEALQPRLNDLRVTALGLRQEVETLRAQDADRAAFLNTVLRRPLLVDTLRELTVALPDTVWLDSVIYQPERTIMTGETAGSAAAIVLELGTRPAFGNPRLSGPVSKTPSNAERFQITIDARDGT